RGLHRQHVVQEAIRLVDVRLRARRSLQRAGGTYMIDVGVSVDDGGHAELMLRQYALDGGEIAPWVHTDRLLCLKIGDNRAVATERAHGKAKYRHVAGYTMPLS